MQVECYPFYVIGLDSKNEIEAWQSFKEEAERVFKWTKGVKVWRYPPKLFTHTDYDDGETFYVVRARVTAFETLPEGLEEAKMEGPYPEPYDYDSAVTGFALK